MKRLLLAILLLPNTAFAQDRDGNDTPGEWLVTHQKNFGIWESFCDQRTTGEVLEQRCYIRVVDVFSLRPKFAAQFVFVTPEPKVDFGIEPRTFFAENGFRIRREGAVAWAAPKAGCMVGLSCSYEGEEAENLLAEMGAGGSFDFDFTDRHGQPQSLAWSLDGFADAMKDFEAESKARGLLPVSDS